VECLSSIFNTISTIGLNSEGNITPDMIEYIKYIMNEFLENMYLDIKDAICFMYDQLIDFLFDIDASVIKKANLAKFTSGNMIDGMVNVTSFSSSKNTIVLQHEFKTIESLKITVKRIFTIFKNLYQYDSNWPKKFNFSINVSDFEKKISNETKTIIKKIIESAKRKVQRKLSSEIFQEITGIKHDLLMNVKNIDFKDIIMNSERKYINIFFRS